MTRPLRVGLFSVGLNTYWKQFKGLRERLVGYAGQVSDLLRAPDTELVDLGLVDDTDGAFEAGHRFREADVDLIFLFVATYALSSTVVPAVRRARVPVIILNLTPGPAIDYSSFNQLGSRHRMTGEWLAWCQPCAVPEIAGVLSRYGIRYFQVTGMVENDPIVHSELQDWLRAARVVHLLEHNRMGALGHYYGGMLDVYSDLTQIGATFGGHVQILEVEELAALRRTVTDSEARDRVTHLKSVMDVSSDCSAAELERAARTSVALDRFVERHGLGSLAYYYEGTGSEENLNVMSSVILGMSLLTARGIPVAGEYEIKNAIAMKIMDGLGAGGSFTEYYAADYQEDIVLMGHDGPGHLGIAEGRTRVRPLQAYHGKVGNGLSVEMSVKHGPVTLLAVVQDQSGGIRLVAAEGESVPGAILEIGNTNSRYRFPLGARRFMEAWNAQGPAHHCAIGGGHVTGSLKKVASLLGIPLVQV